MKYLFLSTIIPTFSLAQDVTQQNLILRHYGFDLLNSVMQNLGYNNEAETIAQHGCWCGKINPNNNYHQYLGGPDPVDGLDEICKEWFKCRNCNDRLPGGSCNDGTGSLTREYLSAGEYTISVNSSSIYDSYCSNSIDTCSADTCTIDLYYITKIVNYYADANNIFQPIYVNNDDQCSTFIMQDVDRSCEGTAPYLTAVEKTAEEIATEAAAAEEAAAEEQAAEEQAALLASGWATVDDSNSNNDDGDDSDTSSGVIAVDPACESTGASTTR